MQWVIHPWTQIDEPAHDVLGLEQKYDLEVLKPVLAHGAFVVLVPIPLQAVALLVELRQER